MQQNFEQVKEEKEASHENENLEASLFKMAVNFDVNPQKEENKNDGLTQKIPVKIEEADDLNLELNDLLDFSSNSSGGED